MSTTSSALWEDPAIYRRRWALLGVMCLSLVLVVLAVSSLNVATPSMQQAIDEVTTATTFDTNGAPAMPPPARLQPIVGTRASNAVSR